MTDQHPMSPSSEQLQQWATEYWGSLGEFIGEGEKYIAIAAYRAGADQELEACVEWMRGSLTPFMPRQAADQLRAARRPKPPSLSEPALAVLDDASDRLDAAHENTIRRALERLQELEGNG